MQSGRDTLASLDESLRELRRETDALDEQFGRAAAELANARQAQLALFARLAKIRIEELAGGELLQTLDDTDRRVNEILAARRQAEASVEAEIAAAEDALLAREQERAAQQSEVEAAAVALDAAEAEAQRRLDADEAYRASLAAADEADATADNAEEKAKAAETDRVEKGKPYEADPVFGYLWRRGYGTSDYRAWPLARTLDGWVARSSRFDAMRRNYALLNEIPRRLARHAERLRAAADDSLEAVRELERHAAEACGVPERRRALEAAEARLAEIDRAIEAQEAVLDSFVEQRARFTAGEDDDFKQCEKLLGEGFERMELRRLRERAAGTRSPEDDRLIDELGALEEERERLQQKVVQYRRLHQTQRERVLGLEDVRRRFKTSRYDDMHSIFSNGSLIAMLLDRALRGSIGAEDLWEALTREHRFRKHDANPWFGTGGFPRARGGSPWRAPGGGKWGGLPKGGGFRTGGGFGRKGFKTGGGF